MPETTDIVLNTGPILALVAALDNLEVLQIYKRVLIPAEVSQEILAGGPTQFAVAQFKQADWLELWPEPLQIAPILANSLDIGEASVIQLAQQENILTVGIDETSGRRVARLSGLLVTGSVGILLRAKREGYNFQMQPTLQRMVEHGIWLSESVINFALRQAGEAD